MARQKKHIRKSSKGKRFLAGKRKRSSVKLPRKEQIEYSNNIISDLKRNKKVKIPEFGTFALKTKRAIKGGKKIQAFGKTFISKSKPKRTIVKFRPSKKLRGGL